MVLLHQDRASNASSVLQYARQPDSTKSYLPPRVSTTVGEKSLSWPKEFGWSL